jgi:Tol biopolymer transport system component
MKTASQTVGSLLWLALTVLSVARCSSDNPLSSTLPGSRIAFTSTLGGLQQVYVIGANGAGLVQVSHTTGEAHWPRWSPNKDQLAFHGTNSIGDPGVDIWVVAPDGTGEVNLTQSPDSYESAPTWSPDGQKLAFVTGRDGNPEIYVMNANGSGQQRLTLNTHHDHLPLWSPKGDRIAFVSNRNDTTDLYVMKPDGSSQQRITHSATVEYDPEWSPDGSLIAFHGGNIDTTQIYAVALDGRETRLTNSLQPVREPSWSPDGKRIAYAGYDGIHVMDRNGSNDHVVPTTDRFDRVPVGPATVERSRSRGVRTSFGRSSSSNLMGPADRT